MNSKVRVAGALVGDIERMQDMRIKYGGFFDALARRFELVEVYNAALRGPERYLNALQTFTPSMRHWKEHFFKNVPAFRARSQRAASHFRKLHGSVDVVLQLGALFDSTWGEGSLPVVIYTDNTTRISTRRPDAGRAPLKSAELLRWLEYEGQLYHRAAHVCVRAGLVRHSLLTDYGMPDERVTVVGGGVNFASLPSPVKREPAAVPTVLFIGQDFYRKGGDLVLRAFAQARARIPDAQLLLVTGEAIPPDLPLEGVHVLPPTWQRDVITDLYRQADVFVLPSRLETWGDVLLEAMAFGLPCIGVRGQAMEEIICHGETGWLVFPEQADDLGDALTQLLSQPGLSRQMGEAARLHVASEFTWERVVERIAPFISAAARQTTTGICQNSS